MSLIQVSPESADWHCSLLRVNGLNVLLDCGLPHTVSFIERHNQDGNNFKNEGNFDKEGGGMPLGSRQTTGPGGGGMYNAGGGGVGGMGGAYGGQGGGTYGGQAGGTYGGQAGGAFGAQGAGSSRMKNNAGNLNGHIGNSGGNDFGGRMNRRNTHADDANSGNELSSGGSSKIGGGNAQNNYGQNNYNAQNYNQRTNTATFYDDPDGTFHFPSDLDPQNTWISDLYESLIPHLAKVDVILISHPDQQHCGALPFLYPRIQREKQRRWENNLGEDDDDDAENNLGDADGGGDGGGDGDGEDEDGGNMNGMSASNRMDMDADDAAEQFLAMQGGNDGNDDGDNVLLGKKGRGGKGSRLKFKIVDFMGNY
jgi:hypothetical protein